MGFSTLSFKAALSRQLVTRSRFSDYRSLSGAFRIQNGGIFDSGTERWVVTYRRTDAVLTATKNVPELGSTLLLLTLGLLGLVTSGISSCANKPDACIGSWMLATASPLL